MHEPIIIEKKNGNGYLKWFMISLSVIGALVYVIYNSVISSQLIEAAHLESEIQSHQAQDTTNQQTQDSRWSSIQEQINTINVNVAVIGQALGTKIKK